MFRKVAVALIAASIFTAPAFAQGTAGSATAPAKATAAAPAKAATPAAAATTKVVAPTVKKVRVGKRHIRGHVKHAKLHRHHVRHAHAGKMMKSAKHGRHLHGSKLVRAATAPVKTAPKTGTN